MSEASPQLVVAVLAAGASRRLGRPKQLVTLDGETLVHRQCRTAIDANLGPVLAIVGCHRDDVSNAVADLAVNVHANPTWQEGLAASIRVAASVAMQLDAAGLLLVHCDQYRISADDLRILRDTWLTNPALGCLASDDREGYLGPPAILPRGRFDLIMRLTGDRGARSALGDEHVDWRRVHIPAASIDLDEPEQLALLQH